MDTIETIRHGSPELFGRAMRPSSRGTYGRRLLRLVRSFLTWIASLLDRRRSRLALLEMTDDQLKDIGLSRCDAHREGIRPIWD
ncbi:DUF1127 domain-containing protein [Mesorhizobium sp. INR15]|uniref:DUF1127 domain-containing protein n=1 Tax=Mesorhizobium sp. INR15 TaxID=2654248 RepID=UPI0018965DA3|nr:DUF1127 domain-containing protein [Mesorhizobium sp. INR15]QPC95274.1 DUF1127 domain-containing protein [Mesorhizobium sp. INR15]